MFWDKLNYPIVGLSPMDGVTDAPMRFITKKYGKADVIYTEFVSAEGLWRIKKRGEMENKIWRNLLYDEFERPVIAQLFGSDPDSFFEAAKIVCEMGFDGIDINMGCPSPGLEKRGGGAGIMRDMGLAGEVIEATRRGTLDNVTRCHSDTGEIREVPVSVKTRIGSSQPDESWWKFLAGQKLPAVAMHGRTFKQLYKGEADWGALLKAAEIIRQNGTKFLGNGDLQKVTQGHSDTQTQCHGDTQTQGHGDTNSSEGTTVVRDKKFVVMLKNGKEVDLTGKMDGVLIGREALGNPWVLRKVTQGHGDTQTQCHSDTQTQCHSDTQTQCHSDMVTLKERLMVMVEHAKKYEEIFKELENSRNRGLKAGGKFQFFPMRKHLVGYTKGFDGSSGLRKKLVMADSAKDVERLTSEFLKKVVS